MWVTTHSAGCLQAMYPRRCHQTCQLFSVLRYFHPIAIIWFIFLSHVLLHTVSSWVCQLVFFRVSGSSMQYWVMHYPPFVPRALPTSTCWIPQANIIIISLWRHSPSSCNKINKIMFRTDRILIISHLLND